jgi:hypothetical protein
MWKLITGEKSMMDTEKYSIEEMSQRQQKSSEGLWGKVLL